MPDTYPALPGVFVVMMVVVVVMVMLLMEIDSLADKILTTVMFSVRNRSFGHVAINLFHPFQTGRECQCYRIALH